MPTPMVPPHVLVLDNDPDMCALFRMLLEDEGYRVSLHHALSDALAVVRSLAPDLVLLDYRWPARETSWDLLWQLRADSATAAIPVVVCSAAVEVLADLAEPLAALGVPVVAKPFEIDAFVAAIGRQLPTPHSVPNRGVQGDHHQRSHAEWFQFHCPIQTGGAVSRTA